MLKMEGEHFLVTAAFCLLFMGVSDGAEKIWMPNTNFHNPVNWAEGRVPSCSNGRIIFPADISLSVFIQDHISFKEMYFQWLPMNGELILSSETLFSVGHLAKDSCEGKDEHFTGTDVHHWYDPSNWHIRDSLGRWPYMASFSSNHTGPVPHSERVPCYYDDVVFPENSTFRVRIEGFRTGVRNFSINGKKLSAETLRSFLESGSGRKQFFVDSSLYFTGRGCGDKSGCSCGNDEPHLLKRICAHLQHPCPELPCKDPVYPEGTCCPVCGSLMTFTYGSSFEMEKLKDFIGSYLRRTKFLGVAVYVFKTFYGKIQAVLVDEQNKQSAALASTLHDEFEYGVERSGLNVLSSEVKVSERWIHEPPSSQDAGLSGGGIATLILAFATAIIIGILFYLQRHRLMPLAFSFARFENDDRYVSREALEMGADILQTFGPLESQPQPMDISKTKTTSAGIDNPFYDPSCAEETENLVQTDSMKAFDAGENPCYMAFERIEDVPQNETEEAVLPTSEDSPLTMQVTKN